MRDKWGLRGNDMPAGLQEDSALWELPKTPASTRAHSDFSVLGAWRYISPGVLSVFMLSPTPGGYQTHLQQDVPPRSAHVTILRQDVPPRSAHVNILRRVGYVSLLLVLTHWKQMSLYPLFAFCFYDWNITSVSGIQHDDSIYIHTATWSPQSV